jgi:uncharacterized membrane protein YhfC
MFTNLCLPIHAYQSMPTNLCLPILVVVYYKRHMNLRMAVFRFVSRLSKMVYCMVTARSNHIR